MFGKNPNFPVVIENELPALEGVTSSKLIAEHLNAMHIARETFIETESSEKLRRALHTKTRAATGLIFDIGDLVYYKRNNLKYWQRLGSVIGKANKQVYVKHRGTFVRVNRCHIRKVNGEGVSNVSES